MSWRETVTRLMRVPPEPEPPPGSEVRTFRAAANYFWFKFIMWLAGTLLVVFFVAVTDAVVFAAFASQAHVRNPSALRIVFSAVTALGVILILFRFTVGAAVMRLDYELRWYMVSDRAIRIREGIITVREKTIALANIQNTVVKQGPLQRLLSIADVEVRTAGGGSGDSGHEKGKQVGEPMHIGYFRGVDNAEEIRDIVLAGVRRHRDSGLGDPDDHHHVEAADPAERLLQETIALRQMLERL